MAGLEMEMYGVYKAAELSTVSPLFFGAKTVVDIADNKKGDALHVYGSVVSARSVAKVVESVLGCDQAARDEIEGGRFKSE